MRMSRHFVLAITPVLLLASCDPFDLVEPRPAHSRSGFQQQQQRGPQQLGPHQRGPHSHHDGATDPRGGMQNDEFAPRTNRGDAPVQERYPMAERTENPNQVISPYAPFNVIDVTGFNPGQLARDPTNNEIFRIP